MIRAFQKNGLILKLKVMPGAKKNEITGIWQDSLKIRVTAQAKAGKANKACIGLLAKELGIPKRNINIIRGHTSREKQVSVYGLDRDGLLTRLGLTTKESSVIISQLKGVR